MLGLSSYNYGHFSPRALSRSGPHLVFPVPGPGEHAPDFQGHDPSTAKTIRLSEYIGQKKRFCWFFGSATCPMTAASIGQINELYDRFTR